MGWPEGPGPPNGGELPRRFFVVIREGVGVMAIKNSELSIFIDESGVFGEYDKHCPFYIISFVLHNQKHDITNNMLRFDNILKNFGLSRHAVHTAPLIRNDVDEYKNFSRTTRKKIFYALFNFARCLPITFLTIVIKKDEYVDSVKLTKKISQALKELIENNCEYFKDFDKIILYYDNGQVQLTKLLIAIFSSTFKNFDMRKVTPVDYKLFQVADLICTLELSYIKTNSIGLSKSELDFYGNKRDFYKNLYKHINKKRL